MLVLAYTDLPSSVMQDAHRRALVEYEADALPLSTQANLLQISRRSLSYKPIATAGGSGDQASY